MTVAATLIVIWADKDDQRDAFGSLTASRITWGVFIAVAGWIAVSFVALAGFHTYLLLVGLGTYDWVVMQVRRRFLSTAAVVLRNLQIRRLKLDVRTWIFLGIGAWDLRLGSSAGEQAFFFTAAV